MSGGQKLQLIFSHIFQSGLPCRINRHITQLQYVVDLSANFKAILPNLQKKTMMMMMMMMIKQFDNVQN